MECWSPTRREHEALTDVGPYPVRMPPCTATWPRPSLPAAGGRFPPWGGCVLAIVVVACSVVSLPARAIGFDAALAAAGSAPRVGGARSVLQARERLDAQLPSATGNPEMTLAPGVGTPGPGLALQLSIAQSWSLDGLAAARRRAAAAEREVLAAEVRVRLLQQRQDVAEAWLNLWTAQAIHDGVKRELTLAEAFVQAVEKAVARGAALQPDVEEARLFAAEVALRVVQAEGLVHVTALRLARTMGRTPEPLPVADGPLPSPRLPKADGWQALAKQGDHLPEATRRRLEAEAARRRAKEASAGHGSQMTLGGSLQRDADGTLAVFGLVGVRWSSLDRGQRSAAVAAAEIANQDAEVQQQSLDAAHALAAAWHEVEHAREEEGLVNERLVPIAEAQVQLRERAQARGVGTVFEVLRARRQRLEAQRQQVEAQGVRVAAEVRAWLLAAEIASGETR